MGGCFGEVLRYTCIRSSMKESFPDKKLVAVKNPSEKVGARTTVWRQIAYRFGSQSESPAALHRLRQVQWKEIWLI